MNRKQMAFTAALAALVVLAAPGLAAGQAVESLWASGPMAIDGVAQEWADSTPIIEEDSRVEYALRNDGRNLYIIMVFKNPMYKSTLDYTGMKIYFTTGPKKSKDYGLLFQKKQMTAEALIASLQKKGQALTEEQKAEIRKKPTHIIFSEELIKPKKAAAAAEAAGEADPPMFRAIEKGRLAVCEFRIPLSRIGAAPGQQILLGFDWGGMTAQIMRDMMAGRADRSVSAGDKGVSSDRGFEDESRDDAGGGIGAGRIPASEFNRDPRYKKHTFWIEAKLAVKG